MAEIEYKAKTGRLSRDEHKKIKAMLDEKISIREIANRLRRAYPQISAYCIKFYGIGEDLTEKEQEGAGFRRELRSRSEWKILQTQFTPIELDYYEELYSNFMRQFKEDIEPTEESQIFSLIDKIIFINRFKTQEKMIQDEILQIDREIANISLSEDITLDATKHKLNNLQNKKQGFMASAKHRTDTYTMLDKQKDDILRHLKGTREQRIKNIESSKDSWIGVIKLLNDKKSREAAGRQAALRKIATDQEEERLKTPFRYEDDGIDQPMLVPEDVRVSDSSGGEDEPMPASLISPDSLSYCGADSDETNNSSI